MSLIDLIQELHNINIFQYGNFILKNGKKSNIYCDFKKIVSYPELLIKICLELGELINFKIYEKDNLIITGIPTGGYIYANGISFLCNVPNILLRSFPKEYANKKLIEGEYKNQNLIIVDDVITSGNSILETIKIFEQMNFVIKEIVVVLDREEGGIELIKNKGYSIKSLFSLSQLYSPLKQSILYNDRSMIQNISQLIKQKQTNLVFALDNTENISNALDLLNNIGSHILGVKIHTDIFDFQNLPMIIGHIQQLKKKHKFLIIDDRKLADIGNISLKQINQIKKWADLVTVYGITGKDMIQELNKVDIGIILIHSLSTRDNMLDIKYSYTMKKIAHQFNNVVGFITQKKVISGLLNFSPGVNIHCKEDNKGQIYNTPKNMINKGTDVFIVGRGIVDVKSCIEYKTQCYPL